MDNVYENTAYVPDGYENSYKASIDTRNTRRPPPNCAPVIPRRNIHNQNAAVHYSNEEKATPTFHSPAAGGPQCTGKNIFSFSTTVANFYISNLILLNKDTIENT